MCVCHHPVRQQNQTLSAYVQPGNAIGIHALQPSPNDTSSPALLLFVQPPRSGPLRGLHPSDLGVTHHAKRPQVLHATLASALVRAANKTKNGIHDWGDFPTTRGMVHPRYKNRSCGQIACVCRSNHSRNMTCAKQLARQHTTPGPQKQQTASGATRSIKRQSSSSWNRNSPPISIPDLQSGSLTQHTTPAVHEQMQGTSHKTVTRQAGLANPLRLRRQRLTD